MMNDLFKDTDVALPEEDLEAFRTIYKVMREAAVKPRVYEAGERSLAYMQRRIEKLKQERDALAQERDESDNE